MSEENRPAGGGSAGSAAQGVSKAVGLISVTVMISRLLGFIRDAVIAAKFGQNAITDAYLYAFTLPDTLWNLVAGGAFFAAFVPVITEYYTHNNERAAWRVFSIITTLVLCALTVVIPLSWWFARPILEHFLAPGLTNHAYVPRFGVVHPLDMAVQMTRIVLPCQYFFFLGTLMMGMLQARKQFLYPALAPVIYNLCIILVGLALSPKLGISAFSWGALAGAGLGSFALQVFAVSKIGARFEWSLYVGHPGVKRAGRLVLPVIFGVSLPQASQIVNGMMVAKVQDAKSILEYSNRLMSLPLGIFGQAIGIAVLPTLTQQATQNDMLSFRRTVNYGIRLALFLTVPVSILMIVLAQPILTVLFQRGNYTAQSTLSAVPALIFFTLGVSAWSAQAVVARAFYARNDTWTPVLAGTFVTFCVFVPLDLALSRMMHVPGTPLITRGPALATSISAVVNTLLLVYFASKRFGGLNVRKLIRSLVRLLIACVPLAVVAYVSHGALAHMFHAQVTHDEAHGHNLLPQLVAMLQLALAGGLGLIAFLATAVFVRSPELKELRPLLSGFTRRFGGPFQRIMRRFT